MIILLKIIAWFLIIVIVGNFIMQFVSYSFYKRVKRKDPVEIVPSYIQFNNDLSGYGTNLDSDEDSVILYFGGSGYIAYNSVGQFAHSFQSAFVSVDYYGTQNSKGKMNLLSMQLSAVQLYDWVKEQYPKKQIIVIGHSYATGIATYLASVRACEKLILISAYRDISDLYNKMLFVFRGPLKLLITNNIKLYEYAKCVTCDVYIIGSDSDKTLNQRLQYKVKDCFANAIIKIFLDIEHEDYMRNKLVINYLKEACF